LQSWPIVAVRMQGNQTKGSDSALSAAALLD
jgi:hypothetical protein